MINLFEKFKSLVKKTENHVKSQDIEPPNLNSILTEFNVDGFTIPNTNELYKVYGRPPKEEDKHLEFPKANLITAKNLPGEWNNNSKKLFILKQMDPFLREALTRCEKLNVLKYIQKLGSYNHRHMRHDENAPLSFHSWACAIDINSEDNFPIYRDKNWTPKKNRGPVPLPFSSEWLKLYPSGMPYELVMAFKSVGFSWGGDWGNDDWMNVINDYGVGHTKPVSFVKDWISVNYVDPMHFELVKR